MKELTSEEVCLALGYFDSMHLGHRNLIAAAREYAKAHGVGCAVFTFANNAYKLFNADGKQVYTYSERAELLNGLCDYILPMRFDSRLKNYSAERFLDALLSHYNVKAFVCGYDYSFGAGAKGDAQFLQEYSSKHGIDCVVVDKFEMDGDRVSTTVVKELLLSGEIERANALLGAPFMVCGKVVKGRGAGRMFDIPTANIKIPLGKLVPKSGVYGTTCEVDGKVYNSATNVGARPTFGLTKTVVETMLDDFNDNIYGKEIKLYFNKFIRPVTKFDTPAELSKQVHADIEWNKK
ncbi:MAG: riboflavin biosynthesis protein RibF [Clostridiales bacterium]|nr:riboflavin biosynthesis protein RibF [Clostridiales bacterium]